MKKKILNNESGFTIIEIIVGINIGFILFSVLLTFFLFSFKFINSTTHKIDEQLKHDDFIIHLHSLLKSEPFYFLNSNNTLMCLNDKADTLRFKDSLITINNIYFIDNIKSYKLELLLEDKSKIKIQKGNVTTSIPRNLNVNSSELKEVKFEYFDTKKNKYDFIYTLPIISKNRFKNLSRNDI